MPDLKQNYYLPGVIILGGHVQALGISRAFGRLKIPVMVIDCRADNISRHSKYCTENHVVSNGKLLDFLNRLISENKFQNWVVFPTNDFHVQLLSQNKEGLEKHFKVSTDKWDSVRIFYNKSETYALAKKLEIPIANTYFPESEEQLRDIHPDFPCIIKPAVMHDFYRQVKKKVFVCKDPKELAENYRKACKIIPANEIIVQNIIIGPSRNQFSACFLFLDGKSYVSITACRMRQHPLDFGNATTYAEAVDEPLLLEYSEQILKAAKYNGLCEVEFKKDDTDGRFKFLEVNTRTWKWHAIAEKAGTPFLENYYRYLLGEKIEAVIGFRKASFRHALTDIPMQLKLMLMGFGYAFRLKRPVVRAVWAWDDMKPYFWEKLYILSFLRNR
jgi:D-aspartate ligase